jgi:hypothetical protein
MKSCERLVAVAIQAVVAANMAYDLIAAACQNGEKLPAEMFKQVIEARQRLSQALSAPHRPWTEDLPLEQRNHLDEPNADTHPLNSKVLGRYEAEQFELFRVK